MFKGFFAELFHSPVFQQWFQTRLCSSEILIKYHRIFTVSFFQNIVAKQVCGGFIKNSVFFESFKSIVVQYVGPQLTVISGSVSTDDMIEVSNAVTWRYLRDQIEFVHRFFLE